MSYAQIVLFIDIKQYEQEKGEPLTREELNRQAAFVIEDAEGLYGLQGASALMPGDPGRARNIK